MYSANLFLHPGAYTNEDAIPNAINYITRFDDQNIFYYGNWPPNKDSAIALFAFLLRISENIIIVPTPEKFIRTQLINLALILQNLFL